MKKNKMMRFASTVLVLTMLSTCAISGTFAKYTTQDSASDTARVAKWGVTLQVDGSLYGQQYKDKPIAVNNDGTITVQTNQTANQKDNVVAPGTQNESNLHFAINGTPEVDSELTATIAVENIYLNAGTYGVMVKAGTVTAESFVADTYYTLSDGTYTLVTGDPANATTDYYTLEDVVTLKTSYYPVIYKLTRGNGEDKNTKDDDGTIAADSLKAVAETIAKQLNGGTEVSPATPAGGKYTYTLSNVKYESNTNLATEIQLSDETISWAWAFDNGENKDKVGNEASDESKADTILGHLMAGDVAVVKQATNTNTYAAPVAAAEANLNDYNLETSFYMDITITQVD